MVFNYFTISSLINALTSFIFCFFVLTRNPRSQLNRSFAFFAFSVGFWAINHFLGFSIQNQTAALFFHRALMAGAIFIPSTFFHFVCVLLGIYDKKKAIILYAYLGSIIFFISDFTPLFIPSVSKKLFFQYFENFGPMYHPFLIMFAGLTLCSHYLMFRGFKSATGARKNQIKYVFVGTLIGFIGGSTSFFLVYNIPIPPIGNCLVTVYILMVAIAIIRHHLMDITVFAVRTIVFIIVYLIVLGIPVVLATFGKSWLLGLGDNWHLDLLLFGMALASAGPFIFMHFQRRAENALLKDQRRYQTALTELSERMTRIRDINRLLEDIVSTITTVRVSFIAIYLKNEEYKSFKLKAHHPEDLKSSLQELISIDDPIISLLSAEKRPLLSEEMGPLKNLGPNPGLILPCFMKDDLLCFIVLGTKPNNKIYTHDDIMVFELLSYSTALAIENSIFWEEIQERQRKERVKEMDVYAYSLAHEIDNPMQVIMGSYYNLKPRLEKPELTEEDKKSMLRSLEFMNEAAIRVTGMVEAIRSFGSRTSGELEPLETKDVIESFIRLYMPQFKAERIVLTKEIPPESIFIRGEKNELITILINFAKNSIHAMEDSKEKKATIKVVCTNSDFVKICFSDTGHGIPKEKIHTIFAPFVTTKASTVGTGMGLYNVVNLAHRNKAKVWAESEGENKGATLILELPIAKDIKKEDILKKEDKRGNWKF